MSEIKIFAEIQKVDEDQRMVYGYATTEAMDSQKEKVSKLAIEEAFPDYMKFSNVREMHQPSAVGLTKEATFDEKGAYIGVKVVDDNAWKKVKEGVYKGFSIGGKMIEKIGDTITKLRLTEISLVDRPSNPDAIFDVVKFDDGASKEETKEGEPEPKEIKKGMWDVGVLANLLANLASLQSSAAWEQEIEGDDSEIPKRLKDAVKNLGSVLRDMVKEEVKEITDAAKSEQAEPISENKEVPAEEKKEEPVEKIDSTQEDLKKMADTITDLSNTLKKMGEEKSTLEKRIQDLEAQPTAPKASLHAVSKEHDMQKLDHENDINKITDPVEMIKKVHQMGPVMLN